MTNREPTVPGADETRPDHLETQGPTVYGIADQVFYLLSPFAPEFFRLLRNVPIEVCGLELEYRHVGSDRIDELFSGL